MNSCPVMTTNMAVHFTLSLQACPNSEILFSQVQSPPYIASFDPLLIPCPEHVQDLLCLRRRVWRPVRAIDCSPQTCLCPHFNQHPLHLTHGIQLQLIHTGKRRLVQLTRVNQIGFGCDAATGLHHLLHHCCKHISIFDIPHMHSEGVFCPQNLSLVGCSQIQ